jgi:pilus assembly protein CpaD
MIPARGNVVMTKWLPLLACLIPAIAVAGCTGTRNAGVESVHQPVVSRADHVLDLAAPGGRLAAGEQQRLGGWLAGMQVGYGDRVALDDAADADTREAVAAMIAGYGLLLANADPAAGGPRPPETIRIVVSRAAARVPGCNDWSRDSSVDYDQNTSSFYGCSVNGNLAAMVANPRDLVRGARGDGLNDPAAVFKAIDSYRKAAPGGGGGQTVKSESAGGK